MTSEAVVSRAALHMWEEPVISGSCGSGAIFFSGCSLGCLYCQNRKISRGEFGKAVTAERLSEIMLELKAKGAHNINLVTPTHFAPTVKNAIISAKEKGLDLPIVYNTSAYDSVDTVKALEGLIDIYLPDMKYYLGRTAKKLSMAENYPEAARRAIAEMVRQKPTPIIENGIMKSGVIVRLLLLPSHTAEAKLILKYLHGTYGDNIYVSLMNQYTPMEDMKPPLNRRVTRAEYNDLIDYAQRIGITLGFTQEFGTAEESFIPDFDNTGV
jgi:putative pyruvate formate lyase activating enzyme